MPNFTFRTGNPLTGRGTNDYTEMKNNARQLIKRRIDNIEAKYPLSHQETQDMFLSKEAATLVNILKDEHNFNTFERFEYITCTIRDEQVPRIPVLSIVGRPRFLSHVEPKYYYASQNIDAYHRADLSVLTEIKRTKLIEWVNLLTKEHRQQEFVIKLMDKFFEEFCPSLWHLQMRWLTLSMCFDHDMKKRAGDQPLRRNQYKWENQPQALGWFIDHQKHITLADQILLGASLLPVVNNTNPRPGEVKARLYGWQKLPGDHV